MRKLGRLFKKLIMPKKRKIKIGQYITAIAKVSKRSFAIAPGAAAAKLADSIIQAVFPIVTVYFAAKTTTSLADAYAGVAGAANEALTYVVVTIALGIITTLWGTVSNYIDQKTSYKIEAFIEDEMMLKFSQLPFALYDDKETVDKYEKAKRFSQYFSYIFRMIGEMLRAVIGTVGSVIALLMVSPLLSLAVLVAVVPGVVIQLRLARQQIQHWEGNIITRRRRYDINYHLLEPRYIGEMRVYGVVRHLINIHAQLRDIDEKGRMQLELKTAWKQLAAKVGEALVELGALIWVALQIIAHSQPVGHFLLVEQLVSRALGDAGSLATQLGRMDEDLANVVDYQEFMDLTLKPSGSKPVAADPQVIQVDNVSFKYPKTDTEVLANISLSISKGDRVAIVGENGAGKSTLVKLLMGLYTPTSGAIKIDGVSLDDIDKESWHSNISLLGQDFIIYDFATMHENITLGDVAQEPSDERISEAVARAEFTSVAKALKYGLNTYTKRWIARDDDEASATDLSGGQRQRLALARNFYRNSPIMILDEPTSAIDALAESRIFKRLFEQKNKTMIIISHRVTAIEKADRVYMLEDGKVVEAGTHQELVNKRGKYYAMFESQIKP